MTLNFERAWREASPLILDGMWTTLHIAVVAIFFGMIIGLVFCVMKLSNSRILRSIAEIYIWIVRGTPMIVQAFFIFFGVNQVLMQVAGFRFTSITAGIITVAINSGSYFAEIFRGGINAVPKGQTEASRSMGMSSFNTMQKVILPQAFRIVLPSVVNQFIISIKDTSILTVIGVGEMVNRTQFYVGSTFLFFETYIIVGGFYLAILSALMVLANRLEVWISYDRKR